MSQEEAAGIMGEDDIQIEKEIETVHPPGTAAPPPATLSELSSVSESPFTLQSKGSAFTLQGISRISKVSEWFTSEVWWLSWSIWAQQFGGPLSHRKCLYSRFAKVNSRTNPSAYSLYQ